ncbi:hypothetical protein [Actinomadura chibensis]|uniref:Uncharacterized protein n=1 Tax=Actinomadura chibensis TaxID=392828 RepID=A0A5D0N929_9ACTN|nr:hypothetical protein [Actinomadura chibensis]TYB40821.1 hypothetical protein FXF69_38035 [Actinomadura chibensis]
MLTQRWGLAWLVASVAFVVVGGGLLGWLTYRAAPDPEPDRLIRRVVASGDGAIGAGGSVSGSSTKVTRPPAGQPPQTAARPGSGEGVSAPGLGAIAVGGDVSDSRTEVTGDDPAGP